MHHIYMYSVARGRLSLYKGAYSTVRYTIPIAFDATLTMTCSSLWHTFRHDHGNVFVVT